MALHTGLCLSEQEGAPWRDVDWEHRILTMPTDESGLTKSRAVERSCDSSADGIAPPNGGLEFIRGGAPDARVWLKHALESVGIRDFSWNRLRHTFASRLVMSGADLRTAAELLRDKTLAMVMRYAHLAPDSRMRAVQRIEEKFAVKSGSGGREAERYLN